MAEIIALYPGSFDPIHWGHIDVAKRAATLFDTLIIAAYAAPRKNILFSIEERLAMIEEAMADVPNVRVTSYNQLTVMFASAIKADVIVRGLRTISDFEYEMQLAHNYRNLNPKLEVVNIMTGMQYSYISSSMVKEIAMGGGDVSRDVPPHVLRRLREKFGQEEQ